MEIINGDCLEEMRKMADNSVDSVVTDPPYGLKFMGKKWDVSVPSVEVWKECLRVLKPGGHLLSFAGTRTQHRMACNVEDAGFEIRDMIAWVYGSGFPKSLDVGKAIDKRGGNSHLTAEIGTALKAARQKRGISITEADGTYCGGVTLWSWYEGRPAGQQMPSDKVMQAIAADWPELRHFAELVAEAERDVVGQSLGNLLAVAPGQDNDRGATTLDVTAPATEEAKQWSGWGTALKPALEPITVARKPLMGTVASNVLEWGTGAINVDGCRVGTDTVESGRAGRTKEGSGLYEGGLQPTLPSTSQGRWPANLIHDGSGEVTGLFPVTTSGARPAGEYSGTTGSVSIGDHGRFTSMAITASKGSASRFFYCAKASKAERWNYLTCDCEAPMIGSWESADQNQTERTDSTSQGPDISEGTSRDGFDSNTASSGNKPTEESPQDSASTTETTTRQTTCFPISNSSMPSLTSGSTEDASSGTENGGSLAESADSSRESERTTGISQGKAGRCTGVAVPATSELSSRKNVCARCGCEVRKEGHPTQKPESLMRYLCRLVTPPNGTVLDPFMGSGSTGKAAVMEGFDFIGMDMDPAYCEIARARITAVR